MNRAKLVNKEIKLKTYTRLMLTQELTDQQLNEYKTLSIQLYGVVV